MKHMKRANIYQLSNYNVTFNPTTKEAYSYKWWAFVKVINGVTVFNAYRYSSSTSKHQYRVRTLLEKLNIKIDLVVRSRSGLQSSNAGHEALERAYKDQNFELVDKIKETFKIEFTDAEIEELYLKMEEKKCEEYLERAFKYSENIYQKGLLNVMIEKEMLKAS